MNGITAWQGHASRRFLARSVSRREGAETVGYERPRDETPGWVPRQRRTWMPDLALGSRAQRRGKAAAVAARLRAARCGPCGLNMPGEACDCPEGA